MAGEGRGSFYDDPDLVDAYLSHRHAPISSPNLAMEDPAFRRELGTVAGLDVLDLGCGDGTFAAECIADGCASYVGVDRSAAMIERARAKVASPAATFLRVDIECLAQVAAFDLVVARMALHYIDDLAATLRRIRSALRPGGRSIATVVHPAVTAARRVPDGLRTQQLVDSYFDEGARDRRWFGATVQWQHRTVETYLELLKDAGLQLETLRECRPTEIAFGGDTAEYERRRQVPLFLLLAARVSRAGD